MKKRRVVCILLAVTLLSALLAGCSSKSSQTSAAQSASTQTASSQSATQSASAQSSGSQASSSQASGSQSSGEIYMFLGSPEFKDATQALCDEYMKENPNVKITYEASEDITTDLAAKINTGTLPDIFMVGTGINLKNYTEYCYDLSDQPLADALTPAARTSLSEGDMLCGWAQACDLFGLIYNMDILNECGITKMPETMSELKDMCEKVSAKGYQVFTTGIKDGWPVKHPFQSFLNMTGEDAATTWKKLSSGEKHISDYPCLYNDYFEFFDLLVKYGGDKPLESTFDQEVAEMANGTAAVMAGQGSWAESSILKAAPNFKLGFCGNPVSENAADCKIELGTSQAVCIWKDSKNLQAALDFANWWNTSDYGKSWFADSVITYPPLTDAKIPTSALTTDALASIQAKGAGNMSIYQIPAAVTDGTLPQIMQNYAAGTITKDEACKQLEESFMEYADQ